MPVDTHAVEYDSRLTRWSMCRDVLQGGYTAVKDAGALYLPMLTIHREEPTEYETYKARAFFNEFARMTLTDLVGRGTKKALNIPIAENSRASQLLQDVTGRRTTVSEFFKQILGETLVTGRGGIFVDFEPSARQFRAFLRYYPAEMITNAFYRDVEGDPIPVIVLYETELSFEKDPFTPEEIEQYRVLSIDADTRVYFQQLWRRNEKGTFVPYAVPGSDSQGRLFPLMDGKPLTEIPFSWIGVNGNTPDYDAPPLEALVHLSLQYYETSADYFSGLAKCGSPPLHIAGQLMQAPGVEGPRDGMLEVGGAGSVLLTDEKGSVQWVSLGDGMEPLRNALKDLLQQAANLGASILHDEKLGVEAAETMRLRREAQTTILASAYTSCIQALTRSINIMFAWEGINEVVQITPETDFAFSAIKPEEIKTWWEVLKQGGITLEAYHRKLIDGEVLSSSMSLEDFRTQLIVDRTFREVFLTAVPPSSVPTEAQGENNGS